MASKRTDYSVQLPDISNPVKGSAGELYEQAGRTEGQANATRGQAEAIGTKANTDALSFLGTTGIAAAKGYLESEEGKEIQNTIDWTEEIGAKGKVTQEEARQFNNSQVAIASVMGEMGATYRPEMAAMSDEGQRIMEAVNQGVLSKEEAITRISATVKKYSAMMPGWAADFRKVAADLTGIEKADVLPVHSFFTKQSAREKELEKRREVQLQLDRETASYFGISLDQLSPEYRKSYAQIKGVKAAQEELKAKLEMGNLAQGEADKAYSQMVTLDVAAQLATMNADLVKLGALHADPKQFIEAQQFGLQLSTKIGLMYNAVSQRVREMVKPDPSRPSLSADHAQKLIDSMKKDFDSYQEMVKSAEGRNMFLNIAKKSENDVTVLMNNFALAAPHTHILGKYGVLPPVFQAYMSMMDPQEFEKRFPRLSGPMQALLNPPSQQMYAGLFGSIVGGQPVDLREVAKLNPDMAKVCATDLLECAKEWSKDANATPEKKVAWRNAMGELGRTLNFSVPKDIDAATKAVETPQFKTFVEGLSYTDKNAALAPLLASIETATRNNITELNSAVAAYNNDPDNKAVAAGWRLRVEQDPISKQLKVVPVNVLRADQWAPPANQIGTWTMGGKVGGITSPAGVGQNARAAQQRAVEVALKINKGAEVYYNVGQMLDVADLGSTVAFRDHVFSMTTTPGKPLSSAFTQQLEATSNAPRNRAVEPMVDALGMAESGGKNVVGDGGKAVGVYQMHPEAMVDAGFKPEDRTDPVKSRQAAINYFGKQLETYGDVLKAIAAWNMGPTGFANHLQKHGDMWMMELPDATKGLIRRFREHYKPK
jgi:hypothetical protein